MLFLTAKCFLIFCFQLVASFVLHSSCCYLFPSSYLLLSHVYFLRITLCLRVFCFLLFAFCLLLSALGFLFSVSCVPSY